MVAPQKDQYRSLNLYKKSSQLKHYDMEKYFSDKKSGKRKNREKISLQFLRKVFSCLSSS